jgi:hypothetical protein
MSIIVTVLALVIIAGGVIVTRVGLFKALAEIWKKPPRAGR